MSRIHTAVIPAAGLGTRFLPATKSVPKELLPIIDTPALQMIVDEAIGAAIDHIVIVTSRSKPAIEAYFADRPDVIAKLRGTGRDDMAERLLAVGRDVRISFAYQEEPLGLGHAVGTARGHVRGEPFAVLLPDELMGAPSFLAQMCRVCETTGGSVVGLKEVAHEEVGAYGVIDPIGAPDADGVVRVRTLVEKPDPAVAPSDLIVIGRYVLTPDVFDEIERVQPGAGGEIQLTDALKAQAARSPFHGVVSAVSRYDTGNPFGWLTAVIDIALADHSVGPELNDWLAARFR